MGCTSSAQNMPPLHVNSGKGHSHETHEVEDHAMEEIEMSEKKGQSKETQVLPTCDKVDSNTISKISHTDSSRDLEKDSRGNGEVTENENSRSDTQGLDMNNDDLGTEGKFDYHLEIEEKLEHLEEVVEKVVELHENGELEVKPTETVEANVEETQSKTQEVADITEELSEDIGEAKKEDHTEEPASPSQSASSRATRWEALADIAAELPPSLAVDPVTGQIYALSKQ